MSEQIEASWERTRGHLARAWVLLPAGAGQDLTMYQEYLDHNELALAAESLELVADRRGASSAVWSALADAATEMGLHEAGRRYQMRARAESPTTSAASPTEVPPTTEDIESVRQAEDVASETEEP